MSKATLLYLRERPVNSKSQGSQSNLRCHNSAGAVAKEHKLPDTSARYRSNSDMPTPSSTDSAKPNVSSSSRGQSSKKSAEEHGRIHTPSRSPPPEQPVPDKGGMTVVSSSKEQNMDITGNKVTAPAASQHFQRQNELITGSIAGR